jgi:hypothetical protein
MKKLFPSVMKKLFPSVMKKFLDKGKGGASKKNHPWG